MYLNHSNLYVPSSSKGLQFFRLTWEINLIGFGKKCDTRRKLGTLISPIPTPKNRGRKKGREISRKLQGKKGGNTQTIPNLKHPFCLKKQHKARAEIPNAGGKSRDRYFSLASGCGCLRKIRSRNTSSTLYIKPTTFRTRVCSYLYVFVSCALGSSLQEISWSDYIHDKHLRIPSHTFAYLRIPSHFCDVHGHQAEERARVMRTGLSR